MNKKKKILFFHFDLQGGGAEKVLVNLLNHLNPEKYDITLQTIFGAGPNVNSLPSHIRFKYLFKKEFRGMNALMKLLSPKALHKLLVKERYDVEIGYMENSPTRIISGCEMPNTKKIAWVHVEIENPKQFICGYRNRDEALACYRKFDKICFVAQTALQSFEEHFPELTVPKSVIYNINDYNLIQRMSKQQIPLSLNSRVINLCSVGRLVSQKRFDRLINVVSRAKSDGYKLNLYILGEGNERDALERQICSLGLTDEVKLVGYDINPYRYVAKMDLFVCSSIKEGYSTAVTEAVSLGVPVLTTKCSGMSEILKGGEFGLIVENNEESLYQGLKKLLDNLDQLQLYRSRIKEFGDYSTESLVRKYEELIDGL